MGDVLPVLFGKQAGEHVLSAGDYLKRKMAMAGLSATTLAAELQVHVQTIYNVTTGKRPISSNLAVKLAHRFTEPVEVWLSEVIDVSIPDDARRALGAKDNWDGDQGEDFVAKSLLTEHGESASGILVDREIAALLSSASATVSITPYSPDRVEPASYDLTVGLVIDRGFNELSRHDWALALRMLHDPEPIAERERERIAMLLERKAGAISYSTRVALPRLGSAVIIAREFVRFGKYYMASVGTTTNNAMRGLMVSHGFQIDPGYSGPMFVTAMNIGLDPIDIQAGDEIVSLSIQRLARAPERAYKQDMAARILRIAEDLDRALKNLFHYKRVGENETKAVSAALDLSVVGPSQDDAANRAVAAIIATLEEQQDEVDIVMSRTIEEALDSVSIDREDAKALIRWLDLPDTEATDNAKKVFVYKGDRQTLLDTLIRLQQKPCKSAVKLMQ